MFYSLPKQYICAKVFNRELVWGPWVEGGFPMASFTLVHIQGVFNAPVIIYGLRGGGRGGEPGGMEEKICV